MSEPALAAVESGDRAARSAAIAAKKLWRDYARTTAAEAAAPALRIGLAASFTANTLLQFVGAHLLANGMPPAFVMGPYNQLFQVCLDPQQSFGEPCDGIVLLWRLEDLVLEEISSFLHGDAAALERAAGKLQSLAGAVGRLRSSFPGLIAVGVPPYPTGVSAALSALDNATVLGAFHRTLVAQFVDQIDRLAGVSLVDLDAVQRQVGLSAAHDARQSFLYRQPFSDAFLLEAGRLVGRVILASRRAAMKCVVLDCDNTLWGGVVGEDGIDGIQLGDDFPGSVYRDLQRLVLYWRSHGIFIALISKNNEADVWEVFDCHDGMVLKREHISAWQINWQPKAENIPLIAKALNIGLDSLVFIDDSAMEIGYMQRARPEVTSILLPEEPAEILTALQQLPLFDQLEVTDEDRKRAEMVRAERGREILGAQVSYEDFLCVLHLRIDLFQARTEELGRIAQLINKTNQFNLTTIRRTLDEVRDLAASPDFRVYGLRVNDKFGEYGLTGAIIVRISPGLHRWTIDTLLLSCRVLGRGVETGLIAALADDARMAGASEFIASFIPTRKNALCASFLPDHGFARLSDQEWRLALADAPTVPSHISRAAARNMLASEAA